MRLFLIPPLTAALLACGGGGTSTSQSSSSPSAYPANSPELGLHTRLSSARSGCGFTQPLQSTALDGTTKAHVDYQLLSNTINEYEDQTTFPAGFTGTYLNQRLTDVGITPSTSALLGYTQISANSAGYSAGTLAATAMLQDPSALPTLMSAYALQGIAVRHTSQLPTWVSTFQQPARSLANVTLASTSVKPAPTQAGFASYPCAGVDDAAFLSKRLGQPIYLAVSPTRHIEASVTLNRVLADGSLSAAIPTTKKACAAVAATFSTPAHLDVASAAPLLCHQALFTPGALSPSTSYQVTISGYDRVNLLSPNAATDIAINRTFRFTTSATVLNF